MIRVVLDTNVVASGIARFATKPTAPSIILRRWLTKTFVVITSAPLLAELNRTLAKPYFAAQISPTDTIQWLEGFPILAEETPLTVVVSGIASHPEDDLVLATAFSGRAEYLVTGDRQLLKLGVYQGVKLVSPAEFIALLDQVSDPATE